ncbi:DegT/DnrJ/EryC1/StrS aminotransferase family protein [uncultured Desulfobacter sp.]|uniref:DegT/DnrJ/EryC1/StrS family aminotransferase n=1 Tax=uncultured Desulfobacter sp. TaxID=240139 RepID=UPI002AAB78D8|nr:DegT/DnrJ/EryC1/StrS aminotransferase family protein [uncultured Desulfobacter sp.]
MRKTFLPLSRPDISDIEIQKTVEVIKSGWWTTGPVVTEFEEKFSEYLQDKEPLAAVGLNSCTAALHLALLALGIGKGDEVILPTWTFVSTGHVVEWTGAKPVLCDIDERTLNIDIERASELITPRTKAIMPVHIAGFPCDMDAVLSLAERHNLKVIEDAAHAIGTEYNGIKIGNFADVTCFSFYATKNLAMGEGGAAVAKNSDIIEKIRKLGYFGINKQAFKRYSQTGSWFYDIEESGYKNNLDSLHAALGLAQLQRLDQMNFRRRQIASLYRKGLSNKLLLPWDDGNHYHTYHLFPIRVDDEDIDRNELIEALKRRNIGTSVHFIPLHLHTHYMQNNEQDNFPVANRVFKRILSIPMFSSMSDEDVAYVVENLNELLQRG